MLTEGSPILRDLGAGLILRCATAADAAPLADFVALVFRDSRSGGPDEYAVAWTRDLLRGDHPTVAVGDFTLVEDTARRRIVSAMGLIGQTWTYGGVPFGVGRPELVGTHPDYRRRGLIHAQFDIIHEWCKERDQPVQVISGIHWYYRQFGYELALPRNGGRTGYTPQVPILPPGTPEPYRLRPATDDDLAFIAEVDAYGSRRSRVACTRDAALWRHQLHGYSPQSVPYRELRVIETAAGALVGFLAHPAELWGPGLTATRFELQPGISWAAVTPSVVRYLDATGAAYAARTAQPQASFTFLLGGEHPVYEVLGERLPRVLRPGTWYVRVADLPRFLCHLAPVLESRLAESALVGHSGELAISFYQGGLRLTWAAGRLAAVTPWAPAWTGDGAAAFPALTFLQLLFGYRTLEELEHAFGDCWATPDARPLLHALFPKQDSDIWPVG